MKATFEAVDWPSVEIEESDISWIENQPNGAVRVQRRSQLKPLVLMGSTTSVYDRFDGASYATLRGESGGEFGRISGREELGREFVGFSTGNTKTQRVADKARLHTVLVV